ncbi:RNA methyltransferase [bacterium]|nr:RNA methyltransferase [bacterium]
MSGSNNNQDVIEILAPYVTPERQEKIESILDHRSYGLTLLLESLYDRGNINAIFRTAENFGIQDIHVVENAKVSKKNRTTKGAHNWIDVYHWSDSLKSIKEIKDRGYRLVVTALCDEAQDLESFEWSERDCVVLGREITGCSPEMIEQADVLLQIPTVGFTQSLNVSIAGAIIISSWHQKVKDRNRPLTTDERLALKAKFYKKAAPPRMVEVLQKKEFI